MSEEIKFSDYIKFGHCRYRTESGSNSAEAFRDDILLPVLKKNPTVTLDMTTEFGLPMSFSEELFGGLIRNNEFNAEELITKLNIISDNPFESDMILRLIKREKPSND